MKKGLIILVCSAVVLAGSILNTSCKKKEAEPDPTVNTDHVDMGTDAMITVDVLANDNYKGTAKLSVSVVSQGTYGTAVVTSDNKVLYTPNTNFYGTATLSYTLSDDNGSRTGSLVVKVGTDAQIKTKAILNTYVPGGLLWLYGVDGDTSRIYIVGYDGVDQINFHSFNSDKIKIYTDIYNPAYAIGKNVGDYTYSITSDGSILTYANSDHSTILLTGLEYFTASAKKHDGSGNMDVSGFTFYYAGKKLDYTTLVE